MASSSLSSVVSNLVRASMGSSVPSTVTDDDLDRHVAELIVREAKKKAERYGQQGIRAYISSNVDSNAPKPNKRFLSSIIKSTDDHNKTVLRAQALAAQEIKREREEQERKQRRARAEEAAEAERLRRSGGSRHGSGSGSKRKRAAARDEEDSWDRWDGRTAERKKVTRNWEAWDGRDEDEERDGTRKRRRSHSRSTSRDRERAGGSSRGTRAGDEDQDHMDRRRRSRSASPRRHKSGEDARRKRRRSHERSHRHSRSHRSRSTSRRSASPSSQREDSKAQRRKRSRSPKYALDDIRDHTPRSRSHRSLSPHFDSTTKLETQESDSGRRPKEIRHRDTRSPSPQLAASYASSSKLKVEDFHKPVASTSRRASSPDDADSRSPSPGPHPPIQLPSKMDRYFEESYDPRLDVAPLAAPTVPATGLIDNAQFEGWDAMLELIRIRREDKEEKKRLERLGLLPPKEKSKSKKKGVTVADSGPAVADRWSGDAVSIMDIEYKKRGSVREWDMGKEGF